MFGVHDRERLDIVEAKLGHALLRLAQHRFGNIDAVKPARRGIVRQRNAGSDAHFKNPPADPFGRGDCGVAAVLEHGPEHQIVNRRPARISLCDRFLVEVGAGQFGHAVALCCEC